MVAEYSLIEMLNICVALNKEKTSFSFSYRVTMRTMIWFPYTFQDFRLQSVTNKSKHPCWSLCADLWAFSKEIGKYQPQCIDSLNRRFEKGVKRSGPLELFFFLLENDSSIHVSSSSTEILPSVHSSRLVMAEYFHCLNFSSVIWPVLTRAEYRL